MLRSKSLPLAGLRKIHPSSLRILLIQISSNSTKTGKVKFQRLLRKSSKRVKAHKELRSQRQLSNNRQQRTRHHKSLKKSKKRLKKLALPKRQRERSEWWWCTYKVKRLLQTPITRGYQATYKLLESGFRNRKNRERQNINWQHRGNISVRAMHLNTLLYVISHTYQ